jgi:uncharacterized protein YceK
VKKLLIAAVLAAGMTGCGTLYQGLQVKGPAVFGGLRLDIEQFDHPQSHAGDMVFYVLDMPFSLAGDVGFLLFSLINELYEWGIDVEPQDPKTLGSPRQVW